MNMDKLSDKEKIIQLQAQIDIIKDTMDYYSDRIDCLTRIIYDNMSYGAIKKINEDSEYNEMTGYEYLMEMRERDD
jgi:hypothetical protein